MGGNDKTLYLYDVLTGKCEKKYFGHDSEINSVSCNQAFNVLASASSDATVKLWDLESAS